MRIARWTLLLGLIGISLNMRADMSLAQTPCKTTLECAQAAVEAAARAEVSLKAIEERIKSPPTISCEAVSENSNFGRAPTIEVKIKPTLGAANYKLVSGGCELSGPEPGAPGGRAHNGPITASRPNEAKDGWYCRAMDPPGIPLAYSVRAWAVFCRIEPK